MVQQGKGGSKAGALERISIFFGLSEVQDQFSSVDEGQRQEGARRERTQERVAHPPPPGGLGSALG